MHDEGPSEAELDLAKDYLIGSSPPTLDSGTPVALVLVEIQSKAKRVARRLLDPDKLSSAVVGDPVDLTSTRIVPDPGL